MIQRDELQLLGVTALFISSKYEEIYPPNVRYFNLDLRVCEYL